MKNIFEPVALKNLRVKNRLVRSATWEGIADDDGQIFDDTYKIYRELAAGGVGAIITGFTSVAANDFLFRRHDETFGQQIDSAIQKARRNYSCGKLRGDKSACTRRILR